MIIGLVIIGIILVLSALFMLKRGSEKFNASPASQVEMYTSAPTITKGLPRGSWGWNPKADASYASKQEQQCTAGGGKITKYSDAFYMCNGAKW